ncbi:hypothetical protein CDAR_236951 [Caerostris darwini]|uniref:Uncharacterized protein n=1 Tax=Caerostris darwini TaxID=1538125 RepID=A0AAV4W104_9ARAC|nr:hypothetical protein CDAR_236951 [Caerostris darwini]
MVQNGAPVPCGTGRFSVNPEERNSLAINKRALLMRIAKPDSCQVHAATSTTTAHTSSDVIPLRHSTGFRDVMAARHWSEKFAVFCDKNCGDSKS